MSSVQVTGSSVGCFPNVSGFGRNDSDMYQNTGNIATTISTSRINALTIGATTLVDCTGPAWRGRSLANRPCRDSADSLSVTT